MILDSITTEFIKDLDVLYDFYVKNKDEHIEVINYKNKKINIDHILISLHLSLYEVPLPQLNKVYVAKSNIEGLGVFAKTNIKKGEVVSMYPSDIVRIYQGNHYFEFKSDRSVKVNLKHAYKTDDCVIFGDAFIDDMNLVGNMINDAAQTDGSNEKYYHESYLKQNVKYYPYKIFVLIVACQDIKKDEELLVSYGIEYWKVIKNNL